MHFVLAFDMGGGPAHTAANQEACPPHHPCQNNNQNTHRGKILGHVRGPRKHFVLFFDKDGGGSSVFACCAQGHHPCQKQIQNALRGRIWIMRGHPAITVKLFLTWTAGVLAYGLVCAGPPDTMMATRRDCALVFDTDGGGRHVSRCVLSRARAHLAHAARAPNMARLARLEHAVHLAHVEHVAHLARQACLARLGPSVARTGSVLVPSSCPSKDGR